MSNGGRVELLEMDELCLKEKYHRPRRANLNKYKLEIHVRNLEDSHIIYRNVGESLRYILILGETYVLNVSDYRTIYHKDGRKKNNVNELGQI